MLTRRILIILVLFLTGLGICFAAEEMPTPQPEGGDTAPADPDAPGEQPAPEKAAPKARPAPPASADELSAAARTAALLDPTLAKELQTAWNPSAKRFDFSAGDNLSVLSLPDGFGIYIASVDAIQGGSQTSDPSVEDTLFSTANFQGNAPLTVSLDPGDYIIGVRALKRVYGFDGDCVLKATTDVITGGKGHAYHLYMLRKQAGEYQCLLANFADSTTTPDLFGDALGTRGTFRIGDEELLAALAQDINVPEETRERVAGQLNRLGVAFYRTNGLDLLVKGFIRGESFVIQEWPLER